ncbi:MAG: SusD/RagB family nutrient-binding outer membrane lipoprotein [Paludibacteraceae bacterium]
MKKLLSIMLTCTFVLTGCSDGFFDINKSPNSATEDNMTPSLVLPRALHRMAEFSATKYDMYNRWMGYWARCSGTYGPNTEEETYQITSSTSRDSWLEMYDILKDFDVIEKNAITREETAYQGIAKIMKSIGFMQLVDQYDNVPYSKSFNLAEYMLTPYDKGSDIYAALITDLEAADALLKAADIADNLDIAKADIAFGGDLDMWRKLGNTQRLRLILHQTELLDATTLKAEVDKIVANGGGFLDADETAEVAPGYAADVKKQNPYWNTFNINDAGGLDNYNRANNYFLAMLKNKLTDPRYEYFYSEAKTPKGGNTYYGFDYGFDYPSGTPEADKYAASNSSNVAGLGIAKSVNMPQWLFTSFESLFLQAEAIQRGILDGVAKDMYETAVEESFLWLGLTSAQATSYLTSTDVTDPVWATTTLDKLELIMTQKYIAMFGINGLETWTDYRRTGFPKNFAIGTKTYTIISVYPNRGSNLIPNRLIYPLEEYQYNAANATAEGTIDPQTKKVFWDK